MRTSKLTINNNGLSLEASLALPAVSGRYPGVVLCHPHPLYGGNMDNNIILAVSRALASSGIAGLRFNFRGVGLSEGSFDSGLGEQDDTMSALSFLMRHEEIDSARIGVMGYSFGGMVALEVGGRAGSVRAIAAVSPVISPGVLKNCIKPKYIICGSEDDLIPFSSIQAGAAEMAEPKKVQVVSGADHFWWGYQDEVAEKVAGFFSDHLAV
ncbi:MAG: alpha/beta hydrolase [Bacillota bacterium]